MCTFSGNVGIVGFDCPGVGCVCRYDIASSICSSIGDKGVRTGSNGFVCNFWGRVYLYCKIKGSSRTSSADWSKGVDDGLLRIGGIP